MNNEPEPTTGTDMDMFGPITPGLPSFDAAITTAASVLRDAREQVGMASSAQLTEIADSWLGIAQLVDRRDRSLGE